MNMWGSMSISRAGRGGVGSISRASVCRGQRAFSWLMNSTCNQSFHSSSAVISIAGLGVFNARFFREPCFFLCILFLFFFSYRKKKTQRMTIGSGQWVLHPDGNRRAHVSWWPRDTSLHYPELCCGVWEYLRQPPCAGRLAEAREYLAELQEYSFMPMQPHRIAWTRAWIDEAVVMEALAAERR